MRARLCGRMTRDELLGQATALGVDLFGVAPASAFPRLLARHPWVRSVLVLGMAVLDPALDYELYVEEGGRQRWSKWAYERLVVAASRLALRVVADGHLAEPLTFEDSLATLDLKAAAIEAGLGVRGLNNLVVTRRYGPRVRFGALLTGLELPADRPLNDYYCSSCSLCVAACRTGALTPDGFDRSRCISEFAPDASMAERQARMLPFPTPYTRAGCAECINACPIGKRLPVRFWGLDVRG